MEKRITPQAITAYLRRLYGKPVKLLSLVEHGKRELAGELKAYGYGTPVFLEYVLGGKRKKAVLETMTPSSFGHDHFSDRAQAILWEHSAFNSLPRHVRSLDSGAFLSSGSIISTGEAEEFFLLTEFIEGEGYFRDLERIQNSGVLSGLDRKRVLALSAYLAGIHGKKLNAPSLYTRRIRDLLGHGECIMGLIDSYPESCESIDRELLRNVELSCMEWRWRIKDRSYRLSQVHGDFHPWNILFRSRTDFTLLDRSRGEWGEPADDVACLSMNYLFSSILRFGRLEGPFETLFRLFWESYLERSGDYSIVEVAPPFYAWRGLVVASPVWYPRLPPGTRKTVFTFIRNVLAGDRFEPEKVNTYLL